MSEGVTKGIATVGAIDLGYDVRGEGEPLLLIAGFGMTRVMWDEAFADSLARLGFTVVRMDNRDTGASTRMRALGVPHVARTFGRFLLGRRARSPYTLEDMANDAALLMAALGHRRFHVVGASMGGMIAQTLALDHAASVASLVSIMSSPGGRRYAVSHLRALRAILAPLPRDPIAQAEHFVRLFRVIHGTGSAFDEPRARGVALALVAAKPSSSGSARQFAAILDSGARRRARLPGITAPTLVVHGSHDPLLPPRGGRATARLIPGAELRIVAGMGHILLEPDYAPLADAIATNARRASGTRSGGLRARA